MMLEAIVELLNKWAVKENDGIDAESIAKFLVENNTIVLPCAIDTDVWCLSTPCGGCPCFNEPMKEEFIEECRKCGLWEVIQCKFDYELISELGETVFLTREQAEEKLKEKLKEVRHNDTSAES